MPSKRPQSNYRLPPEAIEAIPLIREHYCLPSDTAAVAVALRREAARIKAEKAKAAKRLT